MTRQQCYKAVLAYDGTDFCGWEKQARGERTVRGVIENGLQRLTGESVNIAGAGRTDSGVHALGQVISFHLSKPLEEDTLEKLHDWGMDEFRLSPQTALKRDEKE